MAARLEALELFALAGVDLTSPEPVEKTFGVLAGMVTRWEALELSARAGVEPTSHEPVEKAFGTLAGKLHRLRLRRNRRQRKNLRHLCRTNQIPHAQCLTNIVQPVRIRKRQMGRPAIVCVD